MNALMLPDVLSRLSVTGRLTHTLCAVLLSLIISPLAAQSIVELGVHRIDSSVRAHVTDQSSPSSTPFDLYDLWQMGFTQSPRAKAALSRFAEHQEQRAISRGGLLPHIAAGYSRSRIHGWREQPGWFGQITRSDLRYDSTNMYAQLQQPLFNLARYAEFQRGKAVAEFGQAQLALDQEQISLQIAQSYFATLLAFEDWQMQRERADFYAQRLDTFKALMRFDNATPIEVEETAARLATAQADLLRAADTLRTSARQLQSYTGVQPHHLRQLQRESLYQPLADDLDTLQQTALRRNRDIQAAKQELNIYQARVDAARSQYFPTVDLGISWGKADSEDLSTLSQRSNTFAIGVNVSIPIFTGGYTTAATSQARFQWQAAQHRYDATVAKVQAEVQKQYGLYTSGKRRVEAMKAAAESSQRSLDSMLKSFSVGAANNLDVLNAQDQLMQTRYDYYEARLELLLALLRLDAAVGESMHQSIQTMAQQHFQGAIITLPTTLRYWHDNARGWTLFNIQPADSHLVKTKDTMAAIAP